jgi:hypothetical protein
MKLYEYLKENLDRKIVDFHVRSERVQPGMIRIYIHPAFVDGPVYGFTLISTGGMTPEGQVPGYELEQEDGKETVSNGSQGQQRVP